MSQRDFPEGLGEPERVDQVFGLPLCDDLITPIDPLERLALVTIESVARPPLLIGATVPGVPNAVIRPI